MTASDYPKRRQFADLLRELFQLNQPELDFGIYRIMHARKAEIGQFIDTELPRLVGEAFASYQSEGRVAQEQALKQAVRAAEQAGFDPEASPKVQELRAALAAGHAVGREEGEVYDALITFFSRYYDEGDFISRRVYRDGTYAIPYSGEEVVLHWANKDQYYIKSSETLRDYSFRLDPENDAAPQRVHFRLIDAEAGAQNNNKENDASKRLFILDAEQPWAEQPGPQGPELTLHFHYRAATPADWTTKAKRAATAAAVKKPPTQAHLIAIACERLLDEGSELPAAWRTPLAHPYRKADGEFADYPTLQGQLNGYTKRNTFDYFIHKDLGGFLTRELEFYLKNELLHWDELLAHQSDPARLAPLLSKVAVIRAIGAKIIAFLAQLENFQKRLWLKKKFVTEVNYCITLDRLPAGLYPEIAANPSQWAQWEALGVISHGGTEGREEVLRQNPYLMVDTGLFDAGFKARLLAEVEGLDRQCDGVLVHSENFQALKLLETKSSGVVDAIFIDPPYNTGVDGFVYKDSYQHSSWLSLLRDRLISSEPFLSDTGTITVSIDYVEHSRLKLLMDESLINTTFTADIAWEKRYTRSNNANMFYSLKDSVFVYSRCAVNKLKEPRTDSSRGNYTNPDNDERGPWISSSYVNPATKDKRRNLVYPICNPTTGVRVEHPTHAWKYDYNTYLEHLENDRVYWGLDGGYEYPRLKSFLSDAKDEMVPVDVWKHTEAGTTDDGGLIVKGLFGESVFDNPKPTSLIQKLLSLRANDNEVRTALDYFAGSGTTGHAVINLNRDDGGRRKYLLVEMGAYFDTVLKPRLQKVVFAERWKEGRPLVVNAAPSEDDLFADATVNRYNGLSHCFKYLRLESYEDTLANLALKRDKPQEDLFAAQDEEGRRAREAYLLHYLLDVESRGSASLLDLSRFVDPSAYRLKVRNPTGDETREVCVDLLETFNWLLGLEVEYIAAPLHFDAEFTQCEYGRRSAKVRRTENGRWWFRTVTGRNRDGQQLLIVWRNLPSLAAAEADGLLRDNAVLDAVLIDKLKLRLTESPDDEFDLLYVNGDHNITIPRRRNGDPMPARLLLIEEAFHQLMFAEADA